jgi:hypothetical protein
MPRLTASEAQPDVDAEWLICTPESIPGFSAVSYYFGRQLHEELDVPVGLIHSSWGGTRIEPWTDLSSLRQLAPTLRDGNRSGLETALRKSIRYATAGARSPSCVWRVEL